MEGGKRGVTLEILGAGVCTKRACGGPLGLSKLRYLTNTSVWVGWPSPVLSRAIPPQRRWRGWVSDQSSVKRLSTLSVEGGAQGFQKQKKTLVEKQQTPSENHEPNDDTASAAEAIDVGLSILEGPSRGVPAKLLEMGCPDPRRYRMSSR